VHRELQDQGVPCGEKRVARHAPSGDSRDGAEAVSRAEPEVVCIIRIAACNTRAPRTKRCSPAPSLPRA
jgi:hypothetical protein